MKIDSKSTFFLALQVKALILLVRFFVTMARQNHRIALNQNTAGLESKLEYRWIPLTDALSKLWKYLILN